MKQYTALRGLSTHSSLIPSITQSGDYSRDEIISVWSKDQELLGSITVIGDLAYWETEDILSTFPSGYVTIGVMAVDHNGSIVVTIHATRPYGFWYDGNPNILAMIGELTSSRSTGASTIKLIGPHHVYTCGPIGMPLSLRNQAVRLVSLKVIESLSRKTKTRLP